MPLPPSSSRAPSPALTSLNPELGARNAFSGGHASGGPDDALSRRIQAPFEQSFGVLAQNKSAFHQTLTKAFGSEYDVAKAEQLRGRALAGDFSWLPRVQYVDSRALGEGAMGAYDARSGVVYLNRDMAGNPSLLAQTFVEEVGHHLDARLNRADSPGDEGEMFRRILGGEKLSAGQIREIRSENDKGVIEVDGKKVEVEFFLKKAFKKVTGAVKDVVGGAAKAVTKVVGGAADIVKDAAGGLFGGLKSVGETVLGAVKKVGGGLFGGLKKIGGGLFGGLKEIGSGLLKGLGPIGDAIGKVGGFLNKALGKVIQTFDFLSPALLLVPGVGPGLYAAYNVMKTAYYAANGDLKQAFFSGIGALTGVGGMAGKVAGMAQRGMDMYEAAKSALKGDVRGAIGLVGAAAGGYGGKLGATVADAAQMADAGLAVQDGIRRGDMGAVLGGLSAGAGVAGQAKWIDPQAAAKLQEIVGAAGDGAQAFDLMLRGDASGAIAALHQAVGTMAPQLGTERAAAIQEVLGQAARGASAFESLRTRNPMDALATIAGTFAPGDERLVRGGAELARMIDVGDGAGMLRQLELLTAFAGAPLDDVLGGGLADLRAAMEDASPIAMRVANAFQNGLTDDAFDLVQRSVTALSSGHAEQRAGMGLALSRMGFGLAEGIHQADLSGAGRALDLAFAMAGVDAPGRLPSALGLAHLEDLVGGEHLAARAIQSFPSANDAREIAQILGELAPWMDRGAEIFSDVQAGQIERAIRRLFKLVKENGVALPEAQL